MDYQIEGITISVDVLTSELRNSWTASTSKHLTIRTGVLDTIPKIRQFLTAIQSVHSAWRQRHFHSHAPLRFIDCLLCLQRDEWDLISTQDILITWLQTLEDISGEGALIHIAVEHFYLPKNHQAESEFFLKEAAKLSDLLNVRGWESYCKWIDRVVKEVLETIPLESMDAYTLEAELKHFNHEMGSQLLRNLERELQQVILKIGALRQVLQMPADPSDSSLVLEKRVLKIRSEIRRLLRFQHDTLREIARIIPIIEEAHPSFIPLKNKAVLLSHLLKNHLDISEEACGYSMHELMLIQLLNEELDVVTVINCDTGLGRTSMAFALMLAISLLKQAYPNEDIIEWVLGWEVHAKEVNQKIAHMGHEAFEHWLLAMSLDDGEASSKRRARLVEAFRRFFLEVLEKINIPLTKSAGNVQAPDWADSQKTCPDFLLFFPVYGKLKFPEGHCVKTRIIHLDGEGNVSGLTKAGHFLMTQLFLL